MEKDLKDKFSIMFTKYPDIVNITQMREMLGDIGSTLAYKLLEK